MVANVRVLRAYLNYVHEPVFDEVFGILLEQVWSRKMKINWWPRDATTVCDKLGRSICSRTCV